MIGAFDRRGRSVAGAAWRVACTLVSIVFVETLVCGTAAFPVVLVWVGLSRWWAPDPLLWTLIISVLSVPSYIAFALGLMLVSPLVTRVTGARTPADARLPLVEMGWPLMRWARYMVASHVVRVLAGTLFRGSPIWTGYLRLNGARIGRRVYINTLFIADHNLLDIGDDVVIGSEVHLSGHTVESGLLKTGAVRLGAGVTIGLGTVIDIGVVVEEGCQVGAMSLVPKHTVLETGAVYAGVPVRRLDHRE